jgi:hypothetical protein
MKSMSARLQTTILVVRLSMMDLCITGTCRGTCRVIVESWKRHRAPLPVISQPYWEIRSIAKQFRA